ncbi:uncharacterized protein B0H18DRAFT_1120904 [Fomitopsis serialis]|uniref:uncharacterized protein n=1 Tax=Fomitopsis serialis TaxID=139415 RepID=UPI002007632E|nr:uncharacterized protein B0H18DRAFT_1120904 [Neoantrodia serialis]KAH9922523.1 hypothetical protein B0H18DRAFT_1120904 [Neoantrodia serialis]
MALLFAAANALNISTPTAPWSVGESVTETWVSAPGDPASFYLRLYGSTETVLVAADVPTHLGQITFAVPDVPKGEWSIYAVSEDIKQVYATSGRFVID